MKQVQIINTCGAVRVLPDGTAVPTDGEAVTVAATIAAHPVVAGWIDSGELTSVAVAEPKGKKADKTADKAAEIAAAETAVDTAARALADAQAAIAAAPADADDATLDALVTAEAQAQADHGSAVAALAALKG